MDSLLTTTIQLTADGLFTGLIFALIAVGLSLIFGVMDIVNFAHGEFLMLSMYITFWLWSAYGLDPLFALPVSTTLMAVVGVATYRILIKRILDAPMLAQIFATFGLLVFLRSAAQFLWTADYRMVSNPILAGEVEVSGIFVGKPQLVAAIGALATSAFVYWLTNKTYLGIALRATAENKTAASMMGIDADRMYSLAWAIGSGCVGVAGALLASYYFVFPTVGSVFVLAAFVAVALGGFGSVPGALLAGIVIGVAQVVGGFVWDPAYKLIVVLAIYLVVVFFRPRGLLGAA